MILVIKLKAESDSYEIDIECKTSTKDTFSNVDLSLDSITKSISNLTAEVMAIKNLIMNELYSLSRSIGRVQGLKK